MDTILGIDLGTTNSVVSVIRGDEVQVLEEDGQKLVPSVVGLDNDGQLLVGYPAQNQWTLAPERTVRSIKRKMGSGETVPLGDQIYSPQEISAMILRTLRQRASRVLGQDVRKAVITVPAFFNEQQREATREAGELAGLEVERIINEPTAAALTYESNPEKCQRLLVYDLGGGTFDVSIVQVEEGVVEVLSSHGDTQLGGDDFDQLLLDFVCDKFQEEHGIDLRETVTLRSRVLRAVEDVKKQLSFAPFVSLAEEFIAEKDGVPLHLDMELARDDYEPLIEPLVTKTLVCLDEALSDAKLNATEIDHVVLVGGASRTPLVHRMLQEQLGQPIHGEVDPDLCVSMGAAVQGGLIAGLDFGPVLVDITPHTLGVECIGVDSSGFHSPNHFAPIIERNTALPATRSEVFATWHDGQQEVEVEVFQGENEDARLNDFVGSVRLEGLADKPRGNQVLVQFEMDLNGILKVTAREKATGLEAKATIDSAISRFRNDTRDQAQARLGVVFGDEAADVPAEVSPVEDVPAEMRPQIEKASALLEQANHLLADANDQDAEEMRDLIGQLKSAIQARSAEDIDDVSDKLDDIVFYLQDAT